MLVQFRSKSVYSVHSRYQSLCSLGAVLSAVRRRGEARGGAAGGGVAASLALCTHHTGVHLDRDVDYNEDGPGHRSAAVSGVYGYQNANCLERAYPLSINLVTLQ